MLLTTPLPDAPDVFGDHRDAGLRYALPDTLAPALDSNGQPRFCLLRYAGDLSGAQGGLLQITCALSRSDRAELASRLPAGTALHAAAIEHPALRLVLRALGSDTVSAASAWQAVSAASDSGLHSTLFLGAHEAQLLHALITPAHNTAPTVLELELRYEVNGLCPGLPWWVQADAARLRSALSALLPDKPPHSAEHIFMAFQGLPDDVLVFQSMAGAAPASDPVARQDRLREVAARSALPALFRAVPGGYEPHPGLWPQNADAKVAWSLAVLQPERLLRQLRWSVSALHAVQGTDATLFPVHSASGPVGRSTVTVFNTLPLDPTGIAQVVVELRYRAANGSLRHESLDFSSGQPSVRSTTLIHTTLGTGLELAYRLSVFIARPGGFPLVWPPERAFQACPSNQITIDGGSTRLRALLFTAEPGLWAHAQRVRITLEAGAPAETAQVLLTPEAHQQWRVLTDTGPEVALSASAVAEGAESLTLHHGPLEADQLTLHSWQLEPTAPDTIRLRLDSAAAAACAFAAVELRSANASEQAPTTLLNLEAAQARVWSVWRDSLLDPPRYDWRLHLVERNPDGSTQAMRQTDWRSDSTHDLNVSLTP